MRLSEKQLLLVTLGAGGVVAIILAALGFMVFRKNLNQVRQEITDADAKIQNLNKQSNQLEDLKKRVQLLIEKKAQFAKYFPKKEQNTYEGLMDILHNLSREANIFVKNVKQTKEGKTSGPPGTQPTTQGFEKVSYNIQSEGEIFDLIKFLYLLEEEKECGRFIKVDNFSFVPQQDPNKAIETGKLKHTMTVKITTYVYTGN